MFDRVLNMRLKYVGIGILYDFSCVFSYSLHMRENIWLLVYILVFNPYAENYWPCKIHYACQGFVVII